MSLQTHHLQFTMVAATPLELGDNSGSAVRGALVNALLDRFCANKDAPACADCPLYNVCPVAALVAPMRETGEPAGISARVPTSPARRSRAATPPARR